MSQHATGSRFRIVGRPGTGWPGLLFFLSLLCVPGWGCGQGATSGDSSPAGAPAPETGGEPGLSLPADFKPVDRPLDQRKAIFAEAYHFRARAMTEANGIMPMDDAHMPKDDKPAFDKRMAEHKAILDPILNEGMAAIAQKHGVTVEDVARIEQEANRLRWMPPPPPEEPKAK